MAEALSGVALVQAIRPGTPCLFGSFFTAVDMRTGGPSFGTPESVLGTIAGGQLARRYDLPLPGRRRPLLVDTRWTWRPRPSRP